MKLRKYFLPLLLIVLVLTTTASVEAGLSQQHPPDALIRQVLTAIQQELSWNIPMFVDIPGHEHNYMIKNLEAGLPDTHLDGMVYIWIRAYESKDLLEKFGSTSCPPSSIYSGIGEEYGFHGGTVCSIDYYGSTIVVFHVDRFIFEVWDYQENGLGAKAYLEILYRTALAHGLIVEGSTDDPTGTPEVITTVVIETDSAPTITPGMTPEPGGPIVLKASLAGYGEDVQSIQNGPNYEVVIIEGRVTDQEGNGVDGANVEVVSGANSAAISTNADGTYSLVVTVPNGQGNGSVGGVNFTLQLEGDLTIAKIELLQAVSGAELANSKHTAALVFPKFTSQAQSSVDTKITLYVNGQLFKTLPFRVKNNYSVDDHQKVYDAVKFFIPPSFVRAGVFEVRAVIDPENTFTEPDEANNEKTFSQMVSPSRGLSLMMVALSPTVSVKDAQNWAISARRFLVNTYPVPSVRIVQHPVYSNGWLNLAMALRDAAIINNARVAYNAANPSSRVEYAVGLFPPNEYGAGNRGFIYRSMYPGAPLVSIQFPITIAHEIGHVYLGGHEEVDDNPNLGGVSLPEGYIYNFVTGKVRYIRPNSNWINFMGDPYAGHELGGVTVIPWVSPSASNTILNARQAATEHSNKMATMTMQRWSAAAPFDQVLYLSGYFENGQLKLLPPQILNANTIENYPAGELTASLQAADGSPLAEVSFGINHDLGEYGAPNPGAFQVEIPYPSGAVGLVITQGGQELYRLEKSPNVPAIRVDQPGGGSPVDGVTTLTWASSDADGDSPIYNVYYSPDGGVTWQLLAVGWTNTNLPIDASLLPGGDNALVRVTASDGLNTAHADSATFVVPKHAPAVTIFPPGADAEPWVEGHPNLLAAAAEDVEDGLISPESLTWSSDKDGELGKGNALYVALSKGTHTIAVTATDADGQQSKATETVTVSGTSVLPSLNLGLNIAPNTLYLLGGGVLVFLVLGVFLGVIALSLRRKQRWPKPQSQRSRQKFQAGGTPEAVQDEQGRWWYQDPQSGDWSLWDGNAWQPATRQVSPSLPPDQPPRKKTSGSCVFTLIAAFILAVLILGGISLIAFKFFPQYQIKTGKGDLTQILKMGGGGLLVSVLGLVMLNGGFKSIITRRAVVEDDWGHRREKRGCLAVIDGLGRVLFGILLLSGGIGMLALALYQEVLPLLGF